MIRHNIRSFHVVHIDNNNCNPSLIQFGAVRDNRGFEMGYYKHTLLINTQSTKCPFLTSCWVRERILLFWMFVSQVDILVGLAIFTDFSVVDQQ